MQMTSIVGPSSQKESSRAKLVILANFSNLGTNAQNFHSTNFEFNSNIFSISISRFSGGSLSCTHKTKKMHFGYNGKDNGLCDNCQCNEYCHLERCGRSTL